MWLVGGCMRFMDATAFRPSHIPLVLVLLPWQAMI
jgi:hypothetical protein